MTAAILAPDRNGNANSAYSFAGNGSIKVNDSSSLALTGNTMTISYWAMQTVDQGDKQIVLKNIYNGDAGWRTTAVSGKKFTFQIAAAGGWGAVTTITSSAQTLNQWHQIVGTYDGANMKLYVDGALDTGATPSNPIAKTGNILVPGGAGDKSLYIGSWYGASAYFSGSIDDVRLYSQAFTAFEIQKMYAEQAPSHQLAEQK